MTSDGISMIQFAFHSFWAVLMSNRLTEPNYTDLVRITELLILTEAEPNQEYLDKVHWLYENTDEDIMIPLAQLEMLVFYQLHQPNASLNKEVEINDKSYKLIDLYGHLDRVNGKLVTIVVDISRKYNFEIPIGLATQTSRMSF